MRANATAVRAWRIHFIPVFCMLLTAGVFAFKFSRMDALRAQHPEFPPAAWEALPNNGREATSFGLHVLPYHVFSEDFHLYFTRARRIWRFGFVDNPFEPSSSRERDFRNCIQVAVTLPAALFGYSLDCLASVYWVYLSVAFVLTYAATRRLTNNNFAALAGTWLVFFMLGWYGLRISTYLLSVPVMLLGVGDLFSGLSAGGDSARRASSYRNLAIKLLLLGLWDVWCFFALLFTSVHCFIAEAAASVRGSAWRRLAAERMRSFVLPVGVAAAAFRLVNGSLDSDLLMRAGLLNPGFPSLKYAQPGWTAIEALAGMLVIGAVRGRRHPLLLYYAAAAVGYAGLIAFMALVLKVYEYPLHHFRLLYRILFAWLLLAAVFQKPAPARLWTGGLRPPWPRILRGACFAVLIAAGVGFYSRFSPADNYPAFAIPRKYEELFDYLRTSVPEQKRKTLLTLSYEADYLMAYHTDFDLLLPSGFPLHSRRDNKAIMERVAAISNFLGISHADWDRFLTPATPQDQTLWIHSRLEAARAGFLYYLFHQYGLRPEMQGPGGVLSPDQSLRLKEKMVNDIRTSCSRLEAYPDYILSEEVLNFFDVKLPVFAQYEPVFQSGDLVLYKNRSSVTK